MNTNQRPTLFAGLILSLLLVGCAASSGGSPNATSPGATPSDELEATRPPFSTAEPLESEAAMPGAPDDIPGGVWAAVLADLSEMLDQTIEAPTVVSAESITYDDGSLGCPEPGQMYTMALVEGYRVVVEVDGEEFDYRIGNGTDVRLCETGSTLSDNS